MFVRRRPLLRAAAVGGTAYMVGKSRAQHQAQAEQSQPDQAQSGQAQSGQAQSGQAQSGQASAPSQPTSGQPPVPDQLSKLASLHQDGALTDAEFAAAKTRLLGT
jgi:hypothetical protein